MILYKYLSPNRIDVLEKCKIRFTQPGDLNDLFEGKVAFDKLVQDDQMVDSFESQLRVSLKPYYQQIPQSERKKISFEAFVERMKIERPDFYDIFKFICEQSTPGICDGITQAFDANVGILSLTQLPNNEPMWASYADNHKGFVVGFDGSHAYFDQKKSSADEFGYVRKVEYVDKQVSKAMVELTGADLFFIKTSRWAYEEEQRVLRPLREASEIIERKPYSICLFTFPPDIVQEIILGHKTSREDKQHIMDLVQSRFCKAKVYQAGPDIATRSIKLNQIF